nr:ferrous iron transport protein B [Propionibacterium sp.]
MVAVTGSPNSGKSTLFNALTGEASATGNWPGTSVDLAHGVWRELDVDLVDLPGAYSLDPMTPDERFSREVLVEAERRPDLVLVLADAAQLTRSLYLPVQIRELPVRCILVLTKRDVAASRNVTVDPDALGAALGCPVVVVDPRRRTGLQGLADAVRAALAAGVPVPRAHLGPDADELDREDERFAVVDAAVRAGMDLSHEHAADLSDRIDRVATHPVGGPLVFLAVMWLVFQATTTIAAPLQEALDGLVSGPVTDGVRGALASVGWGGGWVEGLLVDGIIAGVGMLLTFVPLMAIMFTLLALLEDSGYMARAAIVTDRLMRTIGLPGKAFLPLVVGFGCNVPAISATRMLTDFRQRVLTALLVPFTSCSGRLTVYVMVATTFFGSRAGTVVFAMYVVSIVFVVVVGLLLRNTLWRSMGNEPMVLDLPSYQRPTLRLLLGSMWVRLSDFLKTVGGIIVVAVSVVWVLQSIPAGPGAFAAIDVADSVYGAAARVVAPLFVPAGFGAWQVVAALAVGFVAKETVITSWAQTYAGSGEGDLARNLTETFAQASGGHTLPAVLAFLVFLVAYTPCVATIAAQRREIGLRWTVLGMLLNLTVAWLAAVAFFQVGRLLW